MKKIIILLMILLLINGCVKFSDIKEKLPGMPGTTTAGKKDFIGGTKGLTTEIISPTESGKVYSSQPFNVAVKLNNEGEAQARGATCVFGSFSECDCQEFTLEGKRKIEGESLEGEWKTLTFEKGMIDKEEGPTSFFITAETRYDYKTYGIIKACVKKDAYSKEGCQISPEKNMLKSASSAPIVISEVKQEIMPETEETVKLIFNIKIKNAGKGELYYSDREKTQCGAPSISPQDKKTISVKMINAPGKAICKTAELREDKIKKLTKDETTTSCEVTGVTTLSETYEPEIALELEYAYETIDSNKFEVV